MKSKHLHARLSNLAKSENLLEIIKDCELSIIKGGDGRCPKLTSCTTFVSCENVYKSRPIDGDTSTTISPTIEL